MPAANDGCPGASIMKGNLEYLTAVDVGEESCRRGDGSSSEGAGRERGKKSNDRRCKRAFSKIPCHTTLWVRRT